jgi:hypothetical protein
MGIEDSSGQAQNGMQVGAFEQHFSHHLSSPAFEE